MGPRSARCCLGEVLCGKLGGTLPGLHYFVYGIW
jgi:hypothetical protein